MSVVNELAVNNITGSIMPLVFMARDCPLAWIEHAKKWCEKASNNSDTAVEASGRSELSVVDAAASALWEH